MSRFRKTNTIISVTFSILLITCLCVVSVNSVKAETGNNITVHYYTSKSESLLFKYPLNYGSIWANGGYVYLAVNMTIENNGYDTFNTDAANFFVVVNNTKYSFDKSGTSDIAAMGDSLWKNVDVPNGGAFTGTLVFQIPWNSKVSSIGYSGLDNQSQSFNIVWASDIPSQTPKVTPTAIPSLTPTPTYASPEPTQKPTSTFISDSSATSFWSIASTIALIVIAILLAVIVVLLLLKWRRKTVSQIS